MKSGSKTWLALILLGAVTAAAGQTCEEAWANYNEFKKRNVMEPSQYALTTYGAAVRAACGPDALPVPPGTDTPRYPIVRKPHKPPPVPPKPQPKP
jgi:hypothetical protein